MLTLMLLRHAKSSRDDPGLADFDRPLNARGERDAPAIGAFMAARGMQFDFVACSPSARTRRTLELVLAALPAKPKVRFDKTLYLASQTTLLRCVHALPGPVRDALIVGHNPGLEELAAQLTGKGLKSDIEAMTAKFPTGALAILTFAETPQRRGWSYIRPASGHLRLFMRPRDHAG
jgi:phosphohistidine phosphatase